MPNYLTRNELAILCDKYSGINEGSLEKIVERIWDQIANGDFALVANDSDNKDILQFIISRLDRGELAVVSSLKDGSLLLNQWIKKAIILYLRLNYCVLVRGEEEHSRQFMSFDKIPQKFSYWEEKELLESGIRIAHGANVRYGSFIGHKSVIMSGAFINIGVRIGEGTMIDANASIGSCAQIGRNCHVSANAAIAGVIEPMQAAPVIIGNNVFIGANCLVAEGIEIGDRAVLGGGVVITGSTKIYDRAKGTITYGVIPSGAVVVPGYVASDGKHGVSAVIVIKQIDKETRQKTSINEMLRELSEDSGNE